MKRDSTFDFVVRKFGFLKQIPIFPHIFDSLLKLRMFICKQELLDVLDHIESEILTWPNTTVTLHPYGGLEFNVHHKEIGHLHSNGLLDVVYSRKMKKTLMEEGRICHHHLFVNSGWISFYISSPEDGAYAIKLLQISYRMKTTNTLTAIPRD